MRNHIMATSAGVSSRFSAIFPSTRFTLDGSEELEEHLRGACQKVLAAVLALVSPQRLEALLLGGGYGRGEGGVLQTATGDRPYNDLEFYVCRRGSHWLNERRYGAALHSLAQTLSRSAGVEVEFKMLTLSKLRRSPIDMFYYDLVMGHRWLWGGESALAGCGHHCAAARIPLAEATRLLMNRCSGLLFAQEQLRREPFTTENADFIGRNLAKAQLAFGDVLLTFHGEYHWSCRERAERLKKIAGQFPRLAEVQMHHAAGVQFKLHPRQTLASRATLQQQHQQLAGLARQLWLWLEGRRLHHSFASIRDYALNPLPKCPETKRWRNYLVNLKTAGPAMFFSTGADRYPRERILHALALLLWVPEILSDPQLLQRVQNSLRTSARSFPDLIEAYRSLWQRFN